MAEEIFSIIMPVWNAEKTINQSIDSVLGQTFSDFKLYIINDGSTDNSEKLILEYDDERIIYLLNKHDKGVAGARNTGIENARGQYITFLDSDDLWLPNKLAMQKSAFNCGYKIVCSNYYTFNGLEISPDKIRTSPEIIKYKDMLHSNFVGNLTGAYDCKILGKFYQKNTGHEDYIMWLGICRSGGDIYCIQQPLAQYRVSTDSLSSNKLKSLKWQWAIYRNELELSFISSIRYFVSYLYYAIKKRK